MVDRISPEARSRNMSKIRNADTGPEMIVRRLIYSMGYRYRLHRRDLPGCPDLVFEGRRKIIFVHGCFWHRHPDCKYAYRPKTRTEFWANKLESNRLRDERNLEELGKMGWECLIIWECEITKTESLREKISAFLM